MESKENNKKISVMIKKPYKKMRHVNITNSLENLQKLVGGYIETVTVASDLVIICNEEGRIKGLEPNCNICGIDFVGTIIIAGINGDDFADVPCTFYQLGRMLPRLLY